MISIDRKTFVLSTLFAFLAWIGNWLNMPLFYGVDFIFGSIAAMLAAAFLGPAAATVIAATGGLYTLALWNQPYALITFTAEALTVALLYRRGLRNLILADLVFWFFLGLPLILLFYHSIIGMEWQSTLLVALKQPLNGLFNAMIAGIILLAVQTALRPTRLTGRFRPSLSELLFHVLLCSILLAGAIPIIVESNAQRDRHEAFMLERLEQIAQRAAADISFAPDAEIKTWQDHLARAQLSPQTSLALLDHDGRILIEQGRLTAIDKQAGETRQLNKGLSIWLPYGELAAMDRWKRGRYLTSVPVTGASDVARVYIEQDAEPLVLDFEKGRLPLFLSLAVLLLSSIIVSYLLSRWLTHSLHNLEAASFDLADAIGNGLKPNLPASPIMEYDNLSKALNQMAQRLTDSFNEQSEILAGLERQVQARTADLKQNRDQYQSLVNNIPGIVYRCKLDENWTMLYMSAIVDNISGYPASDFIDNSVRSYASIIHPDDTERVERSVYHAIASGTGWEMEYRILHKNGSIRWAYEKGTAIADIAGNIDFLDGFILDITDRKQAEAALRESEEKQRHITENIREVFWLRNADNDRLIYINPVYEQIWGRSCQSLYDDPNSFAESIVEDDKPVFFQKMNQYRHSGQFDMKYRIMTPEGNIRWVHAQSFPVKDVNGQIIRHAGRAVDITESMRAESERKRVTHLLTSVLNAASEMSIIATDVAGIITTFNPGAERMLGFSSAEVIGKKTPALFHKTEEVVARGLELSKEFGRSVEGFRVFTEKPEQEGAETREWTYIRKDGRHIPVSLVVTTMRGDKGDITGFLGIAQNIAERKHAEAALKEQSRHTKAILDNIVDGIITIDRTGKIKSFNPAAEKIFGYEADEIAGRNIKILMPNPHRDAHDSYLRHYQSTGIARIIGIGREVEGLRKNGELFPMELAISEITLQDQVMYVGMVRDITERKRVDRMKNEFVATVSHELRTPLTSISGALGLLNGGVLGELPKPVLEIISIAYDNSRRLADLIDDLLDMEKIAGGKLQLNMQKQDLMPLIEQTVDANRTYGIGRRVSLILTGERPKVDIYADAQRLQQVLSNLLSNAIKFSPDGGDVYINVKQINESIRITVADRGPGIPDGFRDRVFQKFAQADASNTRKKGGTGLGLAISKELIERMGGRISFESIEGEGASFYFEMPIWKV
ncbi:PAS domain S-box protein [Methylotuvimicrobium sp.]|uniref:PAS domain S-box protein n=1 Tax=Methylotuvimicrobium sp. TaxID=2822413 RepID=UPI003D65220F